MHVCKWPKCKLVVYFLHSLKLLTKSLACACGCHSNIWHTFWLDYARKWWQSVRYCKWQRCSIFSFELKCVRKRCHRAHSLHIELIELGKVVVFVLNHIFFCTFVHLVIAGTSNRNAYDSCSCNLCALSAIHMSHTTWKAITSKSKTVKTIMPYECFRI